MPDEEWTRIDQRVVALTTFVTALAGILRATGVVRPEHLEFAFQRADEALPAGGEGHGAEWLALMRRFAETIKADPADE